MGSGRSVRRCLAMSRALKRRPLPPDRRWILVGALVCLGLSVPPAGCTLPHRTVEPERSPARLDDVEFVHYLAAAPTVTVEEGARAVLLLTGPTSRWPTFADQRAELARVGAFKERWGLHAEDTLDKGTLAFMLGTICRLPRGLNEVLATWTALGDRRYALRTCVDRGLLAYGLPHEAVAGGELLSALTRAEQILGGPQVDPGAVP